jgi:hypothetical protein
MLNMVCDGLFVFVLTNKDKSLKNTLGFMWLGVS